MKIERKYLLYIVEINQVLYFSTEFPRDLYIEHLKMFYPDLSYSTAQIIKIEETPFTKETHVFRST